MLITSWQITKELLSIYLFLNTSHASIKSAQLLN